MGAGKTKFHFVHKYLMEFGFFYPATFEAGAGVRHNSSCRAEKLPSCVDIRLYGQIFRRTNKNGNV